ncbi:DUF1579 family protein [Rhodanobacter sp. 7MK24]|uniref:DUF1579 family protein n=1 Tax=Rhodanobacter sp. 7MK24 TaxID=2775922 RepID=UPI00178321E7|nr:DUF1579 family protein [Rhodanobacter sp. 7MK24]MBD8881728.1 DUF1579 family protein [Rhodanobacter sp. 7MK24]
MHRSPRAQRGATFALAALAGAAGLFARTAPAQADTAPTLAPLAGFVGHWHCEGRFANGKPIRSSESFTIELGGQWLHMRHADEPPNRYLADSWWGYDKVAKHFTATVFDDFGGDRRYTSIGWAGDTLTLENVATSGYLDRFAFQRHGDDAYRVTYTYRNRSGAWQLGDEQSCMRDAQMPRS